MQGKAIVLSGGVFDRKSAKTTHGLLRGSDRFEVVAVVDPIFYGQDAGQLLDGRNRDIHIYQDVLTFLDQGGTADFCVVGIAPKGGKLPDEMRADVITALNHGISLVSGLHQFLAEDPELFEIAKLNLADIYDIRKPRPRHELSFWKGSIFDVDCPKIAVLGTDCGLGKRTTAKMLVDALRRQNYTAEMIYTGQTGWMQGWKYGYILDSTFNDFVSGELEYMIVKCWENENPDAIIIEGQSSLRNPSGPCGSELILSGNFDGVILQHAPARKFFDGFEKMGLEIPSLASEILLVQAYGVPVIALTLNTKGLTIEEARTIAEEYRLQFNIPVCLALEDGVEALLPLIRKRMKV